MSDKQIARGVSLLKAGKSEEAAALFRALSSRQPESAQAIFGIALNLHRSGALPQAVAVYNTLTSTRLASSACSNRGAALKRMGRMDEAVASYIEAVIRKPDLAEAYANMGAILQETDHPSAAVDACQRAIALAPNLHTSYMAMGHALQDMGNHPGCFRALRRAALAEPTKASTHYNLAEALLLNGNFIDGWNEYEWRWQVQELGFKRPVSDKPEWTGQDLTGKTLLICEEQGFGDTLQFIRLAALVRPLCARVVVQCRAPLARIVASAAGVDEVVTEFPDRSGYDCWVSLMSLMARLGVTLDSVPATTPYLFTPADARRSWASVVPTSGTLKVGLVWAGDPKLGCAAARKMDSRRSVALSQFAPLAQIPHVTWVSLQKGPASKQVESAPGGLTLIDPMDGVRDYADTAAIIEQLDIVIGVDTSVIHLAGALGKPVWALSRFDGCWRWLLDREDSPWYPTLRLFRQEQPGDWGPVVERVRQALTLAAKGAGDTL